MTLVTTQTIHADPLSEVGYIEFALRRLKTNPSTENKINANKWLDRAKYVKIPRIKEIIKRIKSAIDNERYDTAIGLFITQVSHIAL